MSFDISVVVDVEGEDVHLGWWDPTYNLSAMFREVRAFDGDGIRHLDGMRAPHAALVLDDAIGEMEGDPDRFRAHDPPNGWGSFDGVDADSSVVACMRRFRRWCLTVRSDGRVKVT